MTFLFYFEFCSGFYEANFSKVFDCENEKCAIEEMVAYAAGQMFEWAQDFLKKNLGENWVPKDFWDSKLTVLETDSGEEMFNIQNVREIIVKE